MNIFKGGAAQTVPARLNYVSCITKMDLNLVASCIGISCKCAAPLLTCFHRSNHLIFYLFFFRLHTDHFLQIILNLNE